MNVVVVVISIVLSLFVGAIIDVLIFRTLIVGNLRVDTSDPNDSPYLFLELGKPLSCVISKEYVVLKVNTKNFLSQK